MASTIANSPNVPPSNIRTVVRLSTGLLVAVEFQADGSTGSNIYVYTSNDDGATWTMHNPALTEAADNIYNPCGAAVDSADNLHVAYVGDAGSEACYARFSVSHTSVTEDVGEVITNEGQEHTFEDVVVDSTDTPYVTAGIPEQIMGTNYDHLKLLERTGAGSWADHGYFASGSTNHTNCSTAVDSADNLHFVWDEAGTSSHEKFTTTGSGTGSFGTRTNPTSNSKNATSHYVDPDTDQTVVPIQGSLYKGDSGGWTSDTFTLDSVGGASVAHGADGNLYVLYEDTTADDIKENHNTFGNFAEADVTTVEGSTDTYSQPTTRWQQNFENDPSSDVIDTKFVDETNSNLLYTSVDAAGLTGVTDAGSVTTASGNSLSASDTSLSSDVGSVTTASGNSLSASDASLSSDAGSVISSSASPLTSTETTVDALSVYGNVTMPDGTDAGGVTVKAVYNDASQIEYATTDSSGYYEFRGLDAGTWDILFRYEENGIEYNTHNAVVNVE